MKYVTSACLLLLIGFIGLSATPTGEITALQPLQLEKIDELESSDLATRVSAIDVIVQSRKELSSSLMDKLRSQLEKEDRSYLGTTHLVLVALAKHRIEEAVPQLIDQINYTLDRSTINPGITLTTSSFYPVARALVDIGGAQVVPLTLQKLSESDDDELQRLCAWVLCEHLGSSVAAKIIDERSKSTKSEEARARYVKAYELLRSKEVILLHPKTYE